jgi:hypothetical protein
LTNGFSWVIFAEKLNQMKIERKAADPIEVFIPFTIQITLESKKETDLFDFMVRSAMAEDNDELVGLCEDILNVL